MQQLTPKFILNQTANRQQTGTFEAATLFVDTSGFTPLTERLSRHGREGAEILADILQAVFEPLVDTVYRHGGFIAGFAGDAFKAVFPASEAEKTGKTGPSPIESHLLTALTAAQHIQTHMEENREYNTRFGPFTFSVRLSVASGPVNWAIWDADLAQAPQRSGYTFSGRAIEMAIQGEDFAAGGELIISQTVYERVTALEAAVLEAKRLSGPAGSYLRLDRFVPPPGANIEAEPDVHTQQASQPHIDPSEISSASAFYPAELLNSDIRGEFRPVYTLFVNFERLPQPGEPDNFLPRFFELLSRYDGFLCRIGRIGSGDPGGTFLLFFGAPSGHENDLTRTLEFVLALRAEIPIRLRAGITHALVYAGFIGGQQRSEYTCYGSRVNQAARQMGKADWGEILLDDATARRGEERFDIELAGHFSLKGLADEQPLFHLHHRRAEVLQAVYRTSFVGRSAELSTLRQALTPLLDGRFGGVTLLTGEAGIGKSRLLEQFIHELETVHGIRVWVTQTDEILRESLNPLRIFLQRYFDLPVSQAVSQEKEKDRESQWQRIEKRLADLISYLEKEREDQSLGQQLQRSESFLAGLLNLHQPGSLYDRSEPQLRFDNSVKGIKSLLKAESLRGPCMLVIEDGQWLDQDSRSWIEQATHNVEGYPFGIILTSRPLPEGEPPLLPAEQINNRVMLGPITPTDVAEIGTALLGGPLPLSEPLINLLWERAGGNPFFVEQMTLFLHEQGSLLEEADGWVLATDASDAENLLPTDLQTILVARLDRLTQEVKQVVQTAAVLGREFSVQILSNMLQGDVQLGPKVESAQDAAVWAAVTELRYLFRHALLRDAAYEMQLRSRLRALHRLAAQSYEQLYAIGSRAPVFADLVYHFQHAEEREQERHYALLAAEKATAEYANEDAIAYYTRVIALTPVADLETRFDLHMKRLAIYDLRVMRAEQEAELNQLTDLAEQLDSNQYRARVALQWAGFAESTADFNSLLPHAEAVLRLVPDRPALTAQAKAHLAGRLQHIGSLNEAQTLAKEAVLLAKEAGQLETEADTLDHLGMIQFYLGHYQESVTCFKRVLAIRERLNNPLAVGRVLNSLGIVNSKIEEYESTAYYDQALEIWTEIGYARGEQIAGNGIGNIHLAAGRYSLAQRYYRDSLEKSIENNDRNSEANLHFNLGIVASRVGQYATAIDQYEIAQTRYREIGNRGGVATCHSSFGNIERQRGNLELSRRHFETALAQQEEIGLKSERSDTLTSLGATLFYLGEIEASQQSFETSLRIRRELGRDTIALVPHLWLGRIAAEKGETEAALATVEQNIPQIEAGAADRTYDPGQFYRVLIETLESLNHPQRDFFLKRAYDLIRQRADLIADEGMRHSYLTAIPAHQMLLVAFEKKGTLL